MSNKEIILNEFESLKGQFVINASWKIERLVAIGSDKYDYYWITYNGRKFTWSSCVGGLMPLKGHLRDEDYNELVRLAKLNHFDQAECWANRTDTELNIQKHKFECMECGAEDEYLTPICWDLI